MEKNTVFVDTSAWYALADQSDQYHNQAINIYPKLLTDYHHLTTTNLVMAETYILIRRSLGYQPAMIFLENISASPRVLKIYSDSFLEKTAVGILGKYKDQDFSYTDSVSFAIMKQSGIAQAFAFDQHFSTAGFTLISEFQEPSATSM